MEGERLMPQALDYLQYQQIAQNLHFRSSLNLLQAFLRPYSKRREVPAKYLIFEIWSMDSPSHISLKPPCSHQSQWLALDCQQNWLKSQYKPQRSNLSLWCSHLNWPQMQQAVWMSWYRSKPILWTCLLIDQRLF